MGRLRVSLFCLITAIAIAGDAKAAERVAILVRPAVWEVLRVDIERYQDAVKSERKVEFEMLVSDFRDAADVRQRLKTLWTEKRIEGAILVGAIPMHQFFMHEHANPNPLFYEDFDLPFVDANEDGVDDAYRGKPNPKIWIANVRSSELATNDDIDGLRRFFTKANAYHNNLVRYVHKAVIITDAELGMREDETRFAQTLFGESGVDFFASPNNTLENFRKTFQQKPYAICVMGVHSDWSAQELVGGELTAEEIRRLTTGAILTLNHGCSTGNWCAAESEKSGMSTAQSWVFGDSVGLTVIANVRSGCIYGCEKLTKSLANGRTIAQAYWEAKRAGEREMNEEYPDGSIVSGVLLIGDPFLVFEKR